MMKFIKTLTALALTTATGIALAAPSSPINANKVTQNQTVNYQCQDGRVKVTYGFNKAGIPVKATATINGKKRVMTYNRAKSNNVDTVFKNANGYTLNAEAFELHNVRKKSIVNITAPNGNLAFKICDPR